MGAGESAKTHASNIPADQAAVVPRTVARMRSGVFWRMLRPIHPVMAASTTSATPSSAATLVGTPPPP